MWNNNESEQAADAHVPLQSKSYKFLPQKLWGMPWHPGDGGRPSVWETWHLLNLLFHTMQNNFAAQCRSCWLSAMTKGLPSPSSHCSLHCRFTASATHCNKNAGFYYKGPSDSLKATFVLGAIDNALSTENCAFMRWCMCQQCLSAF